VNTSQFVKILRFKGGISLQLGQQISKVWLSGDHSLSYSASLQFVANDFSATLSTQYKNGLLCFKCGKQRLCLFTPLFLLGVSVMSVTCTVVFARDEDRHKSRSQNGKWCRCWNLHLFPTFPSSQNSEQEIWQVL
jgi:hypothetical protein